MARHGVIERRRRAEVVDRRLGHLRRGQRESRAQEPDVGAGLLADVFAGVGR
jgi:hypothetical protein